MKTRNVYAVILVSEERMHKIVHDVLLPEHAFFNYEESLPVTDNAPSRVVGKVAVVSAKLDEALHYSEFHKTVFKEWARQVKEQCEFLAVGQKHHQDDSSIRGIYTILKDRLGLNEVEGGTPIFDSLVFDNKAPKLIHLEME